MKTKPTEKTEAKRRKAAKKPNQFAPKEGEEPAVKMAEAAAADAAATAHVTK